MEAGREKSLMLVMRVIRIACMSPTVGSQFPIPDQESFAKVQQSYELPKPEVQSLFGPMVAVYDF